MTVPSLEVRPLADQVEALLRGIANLNTFRGKVDLPPYDLSDPATHPFWDLDSSGRVENVHAYCVFYPSPGRRSSSRLNAAPGRLAWSFQVTCVGGDDNRCLWCVDRVAGALTGVRLALAAGQSGKIREPGDVGPVRRDDDETPVRFFVPLMFGVHVAG